MPCSEGISPPQGAAMGSCSSALVDEHETIFKKNPRRVVRPAGESCVVVGGLDADVAGGGWPLLPRLRWAFGVDGRGWGSPLLEGAAGLC